MTRDEFLSLAFRNPVNAAIVDELFTLALTDAWLVSGCLVQTVWNVKTGRDVDYGISDYDVFYFDPDTSWEAEDAVIRTLTKRFEKLGVTVEARNQARVHLWYAEKHGLPYPPLHSSTEGIDRFLTKNTRIGIRRTEAGYDVYAPDGFDDAANLIARPNMTANFSAESYVKKTARWKALWPGVTVVSSFRDGALAPDPESRDSQMRNCAS